jgi:hypothetical protein
MDKIKIQFFKKINARQKVLISAARWLSPPQTKKHSIIFWRAFCCDNSSSSSDGLKACYMKDNQTNTHTLSRFTMQQGRFLDYRQVKKETEKRGGP